MSNQQQEEMWSGMLDDLMDGIDDWEEIFTAWEQNFIESIDSQVDFKSFADLTDKQRDKLEQLWQKLKAHTG